MALEFQEVELPLTGGLREDVDEHSLQPGQFRRLENYYHDREGALTPRPSRDYTGLGASERPAGGGAATTFAPPHIQSWCRNGTDLGAVQLDGTARNYNGESWRDAGRHPAVKLTQAQVAASGPAPNASGLAACGLAVGTDYIAEAYFTPTLNTAVPSSFGTGSYRIIKTTTGEVIAQGTLESSSVATTIGVEGGEFWCGVHANGNTFYFVYLANATLRVSSWTLTGGMAAATTLASDVCTGGGCVAASGAVGCVDMVGYNSGSAYLHILYFRDDSGGSGNQMPWYLMSVNGAAASVSRGPSEAAGVGTDVDINRTNAVCVERGASTVILGWIDDTNGLCASSVNRTTGAVVVSRRVQAAAVTGSSRLAYLPENTGVTAGFYYTVPGATLHNTDRIDFVASTEALTAPVAATTFLRGCSLASKPAYVDAVYHNATASSTLQRAFMQVAYQEGGVSLVPTGVQYSNFIVDTAGKLWARLAPGEGLGFASLMPAAYYAGGGLPPTIPPSSSNKVSYLRGLHHIQTSRTGSGIVQTTRMMEFTLDFLAPQAKPLDLGDYVLLPGGHLSVWDGLSMVPQGFHTYPIVTVASGGAGAFTGVFTAVACYVWYDKYGRPHRSQVSVPASVTLAANSLSVAVSTVRLEAGARSVWIEVYVTAAGSSGPYYLSGNVALNDATADTVTVAVTSITTTNRTVYTTGGVLDTAGLGAVVALAKRGDQVFAASSERPSRVLVSKPRDPELPPEFSDDASTFVETPDDGAVNGLVTLDGTVYALKSDSIYTFQGDGPNALGQGLFSIVERLPTAVEGLNLATGLLETPDGFMFAGRNSIYLMTRSREIVDLGRQVRDSFSAGMFSSNLTGTVWDPSRQLAIFCSVWTSSSSSIAYWLVWEVKTRGWALWKIDDDSFLTQAHYYRDSSGGKLVGLASDTSQTYPFSMVDTYTGGDDDFTSYAELAPLRAAAVNGFQRVKEIAIGGKTGATRTGLALDLKYWTHNSGTYPTAATETFALDLSTESASAYWARRFRPQYQKARFIRLDIREDSVTSGVNPNRVTSLSLKLAGKRGFAKTLTQET